jgi:hypothetical protein
MSGYPIGSSTRKIADDLAQSVARILRGSMPPSIKREIMSVTRNNGDGTLDLERGDSEASQPMQGIPALTSCSAAKSGDRVLVDTCNHVSYVMGILA